MTVFKYKGAFDCKNCPGNNDPSKGRACPGWWETTFESISDPQNVKYEKSCYLTQLPIYLTEVIRASNRPAAAVESMRNETIKQMEKFTIVLAKASFVLADHAQLQKLGPELKAHAEQLHNVLEDKSNAESN